MSQALVISGADVAIVDLNSTFNTTVWYGHSLIVDRRGGSTTSGGDSCRGFQKREPGRR
jgi:hypothetical protein